MTIQKLDKIIKDINKDNARLEVSDFSDDGSDLEELNDIIEGND
jgi:hypothetical protein